MKTTSKIAAVTLLLSTSVLGHIPEALAFNTTPVNSFGQPVSSGPVNTFGQHVGSTPVNTFGERVGSTPVNTLGQHVGSTPVDTFGHTVGTTPVNTFGQHVGSTPVNAFNNTVPAIKPPSTTPVNSLGLPVAATKPLTITGPGTTFSNIVVRTKLLTTAGGLIANTGSFAVQNIKASTPTTSIAIPKNPNGSANGSGYYAIYGNSGMSEGDRAVAKGAPVPKPGDAGYLGTQIVRVYKENDDGTETPVSISITPGSAGAIKIPGLLPGQPNPALAGGTPQQNLNAVDQLINQTLALPNPPRYGNAPDREQFITAYWDLQSTNPNGQAPVTGQPLTITKPVVQPDDNSSGFGRFP